MPQKKKRANKGGRGKKPFPQKGAQNKSGVDLGREESAGQSKFRACGSDTIHNNPSWYEPFSGATERVAKIPFGYPAGYPFNVPGYGQFLGYANSGATSAAFPGIMRIGYIPTPGISKSGDINSPINIAAKAYYTTVRYRQRGSGTYDDANLMMGVLAISSIFELWAELRRAFGIINAYSVNNRYIAPPLLEALGYDFDDLQAHQYDLQALLNSLAYKLGSFCLPADFSMVERRVRMNSNVYTDGEGSKAQMYVFQPDFFWLYDEFGDEAGETLKPYHIPRTSNGLTGFADINTAINTLFNAARSSQSLMNMTGDVLNAYEGNIKHVTTTAQDYLVPILYDPEMVMEIQNTIVIPLGHDEDVGDMSTQGLIIRAENDKNVVTFEPSFDVLGTWPDQKGYFLNMRKDDPTAYDVMRASRLMPAIKTEWDGTDTTAVIVESCGSEIATSITMTMIMVVDGVFTTEHYTVTDSWYSAARPLAGGFVTVSLMEKFDYHPYLYYYTGSAGSYDLVSVSGDVDNITILNDTAIKQINEYAILGEFKTNQMGSFLVLRN